MTGIVQPMLFAPPRPPSLESRGIDLRNCDTIDMMRSLPDNCASLVVIDPPWSYVQKVGATRADNHYDCLTLSDISGHFAEASRLAPLAILWCTYPKLGEWMEAETPWGPPVTGGSWVKSGPDDSGHFGQGHWFSGCAELFLLYKMDSAYCDRSEPVRNAWIEPPNRHSRKPVGLQRHWVSKFVPPGGLVVDVYAGLGSVAEAVLLAGGGRRYVGAEISAERHADACSLLAQVRAP